MNRNRVYVVLAIAFTLISAALMQTAKGLGWLTLIKRPLTIRKPLQDLDRGKLAPYRVARVRNLTADTVQELGTSEFIDWSLENPAGTNGATALANLFLTYYTGVTDQVPHVPEECFQQGAFSLEKDEEIKLRLPTLGREVPVRRLIFLPPESASRRGDKKQTVVYYMFSVNGDFLASRDDVRNRMLDPRDKHLYYSKVEVAFPAATGFDRGTIDSAAAQLLDVAVTELAGAHWPLSEWARTGPPSASP